MPHSSHAKRLTKNRKAFSAIVGTIFMVLVVLFLYFNVYMFMQTQDTKLQDIVSQSHQLDADHSAEQLTTRGTYATSGPTVTVTCTIINNSSIPVQIVRAWVQDSQPALNTRNILWTQASQPRPLNPGTIEQSVTFSINMGITEAGTLRVWFVTSRGNSFSFLTS